uniref:F-box domain-containing protein n=1 Tax=Meloidogyne enterolobii TaxID=390850 RepID=A0A6V7URY4_MELEN|nr:unnamed protein product [Meloidogyne enterolobii]
MLLNFPVEVKLDILKFLKFNQLLSLQQTNYYFYCLIRQNERILACRRLHLVGTGMCDIKRCPTRFIYEIVNLESESFNVLLEDNLLKMPNFPALVYLSTCDTPPTQKLFTYVKLNNIRFGNLCGLVNYILKLPVYPKNIEEMKIVRCWLEKLFLCYFEYIEFFRYFFNPEMIKILFDNEKYISTQIRGERCWSGFSNHNINNSVKFHLDHLFLTDYIDIDFELHGKKEKCNKHLLELLINGGKNIPKVTIRTEKQTLLDLIMKHIETKDCSNFISNIKIVDRKGLNGQHTPIEGKPIYIIRNTFNPEMIFRIYCEKEWGNILVYTIKVGDED